VRNEIVGKQRHLRGRIRIIHYTKNDDEMHKFLNVGRKYLDNNKIAIYMISRAKFVLINRHIGYWKLRVIPGI
jgi:hypothetical protein